MCWGHAAITHISSATILSSSLPPTVHTQYKLPPPPSPLSPPPRRALRPAPALAPLGAACARHHPRSPLEPRELSEPLKQKSQGVSTTSGPAFETTSAAAAAQPGNARLGQLGPGAGLSIAVAAEPAAQVLRQPGIRLAAFPGRPVLEPWGPPSPCLPRCPGPGTADLCYRRRPLHAPLPASADRDPG